MTDRVDEWALNYLHDFDGTPMQSVAKGAVDLGTLQDYAEMMFENYYGMLDSFDDIKAPTPDEIVTYVMAWNKNSVDYMLVRATRGFNRQQNYVKRYKDYKYGALPIVPIRLPSKKCQRTEINLLQNYSAIGSKLGRPLYPCRD